MRAVLGRSRNVTRGLDALGRLGCSLGQGAIIWQLAGQQRFSVSGTKRCVCRARDTNPYPSAMAFGIQCDDSGNSNHGKARSRLWHFEVGATGASSTWRHSYLGENLTGLQRRGQQIDKEILGFEASFSARSHRLYFSLQGQDSVGIVRARV